MPVLVTPAARHRRSFVEAMAEFRGEGRGADGDGSMLANEMRRHGATWDSEAGFAAFVAELVAARLEETPRPDGFVASTTLWYADGDVYHGRLTIRHRLTPLLLEEGGHIGYDVRPSSRHRGYATAMLAEALPIARALGICDVLLTCDDSNIASRSVIERNGGVLEDVRSGKRRYWIREEPPA
jgi:predicted acetyltransferase